MKKILLLSITLLLLFSCDFFQEDYRNFAIAYKKILIAREVYQEDSLKSNSEIEKIYKEYGFTQESFQEEYFDLAKNEPKIFQEILDSLRETTQRDLIEYQEKFNTKRKQKE